MKTLPLLLLSTLLALPAHAELPLGEDTTLHFATVEEGRAILTARDEFVERMSPFDRAGRLETDQPVSESEYRAFVGEHVLAWTDEERAQIAEHYETVRPGLEALKLPFPEKIWFVKTSGREEGGAAYTRGNAIVLNAPALAELGEGAPKTICHELFHILTRGHPELREKLYESIGFLKCQEIEFPSALRTRKLTNPDAPRNDHLIRLTVDGVEQWTLPLLFSAVETYPVDQGGPFFQYVLFQWLVVEREGDAPPYRAVYDVDAPVLAEMGQIGGLMEQIGQNTGYIIHPEEILADNFALLAMGATDMPSPEIVEAIGAILAEATAETKAE